MGRVVGVSNQVFIIVGLGNPRVSARHCAKLYIVLFFNAHIESLQAFYLQFPVRLHFRYPVCPSNAELSNMPTFTETNSFEVSVVIHLYLLFFFLPVIRKST